MPADASTVDAVVAAVKGSRKYGDTSEVTIRQLAEEAVAQHKKPKAAEKAVRKRLHSIMAPYLGDPDYEAAAHRLDEVFATGERALINATCYDIQYAHLSTRERQPLLDTFYRDIFAHTGPPRRLLDLGCGLNPLAFPWMDLSPATTEYWAYDIHEPRVAFINHYFRLEGLPPLARVQDIALEPPVESGDVALFLKEMPRYERNYPGHGRPLLLGLNVDHLVVSFPTVSTHGGRNLTARYRDFFQELVDGTGWPVAELLYESELVFIATKNAGGNR